MFNLPNIDLSAIDTEKLVGIIRNPELAGSPAQKEVVTKAKALIEPQVLEECLSLAEEGKTGEMMSLAQSRVGMFQMIQLAGLSSSPGAKELLQAVSKQA